LVIALVSSLISYRASLENRRQAKEAAEAASVQADAARQSAEEMERLR